MHLLLLLLRLLLLILLLLLSLSAKHVPLLYIIFQGVSCCKGSLLVKHEFVHPVVPFLRASLFCIAGSYLVSEAKYSLAYTVARVGHVEARFELDFSS